MEQVIDASAMLAYLKKEHDHGKVKELWSKASVDEKKILMSSINWGEVYYILIKNLGLEEAKKILRLVETFPVQVMSIDQEMAQKAAEYKIAKKLSYADGFAAALAKTFNAELITADKGFKTVEDEIKVIWI